MKILLLGTKSTKINTFLISRGEEVIINSEKITIEYIKENDVDFIISYGYRHIIKSDVINYFEGKIINLHISYLPFNRGADPNLWSIIDETPSGVTIHNIDCGLDTGDILVQKKVQISDSETLESSYELLQNEIQNLFISNWENIKFLKIKPFKQFGPGTYHKSSDKNIVLRGIENKWIKMTIKELRRHIHEQNN